MPDYGKMSTRELDFDAKPESIKSDIGRISSSGSTSWSRLKDPRIVRVSRAFGGKDRHSKVCTVKGLRDRRVRLSVPTAIQLYDLQDRLGLNQPSKVVDWLLNAAKHEIDELPPLQIPPGSNFSHPLLNSHEFIRPPQSDKEFLKISRDINWNEPLKQSQSTDLWGDKSKDVLGGTTMERSDEDEKLCNLEGQEAYVSSNNLFPRPNQSSVPGFLNNAMQYNSNFLRWDPSNLSLRSAGLPAQPEDFHNFNVLEPLPSSAVSVPSGSQQVLVYQPRMTQSYFPSPQEFDKKQVNFQMMNPSSQLSNSPVHSTAESVRHFNFSMTASLLPSQNSNGGKEPNKHEEFNDSV